jgi:hypothetical protein
MKLRAPCVEKSREKCQHRLGVEDLRRKTVVECVLFMLCLLALTPPFLLFFVTFAQDQRVCGEGLC